MPIARLRTTATMECPMKERLLIMNGQRIVQAAKATDSLDECSRQGGASKPGIYRSIARPKRPTRRQTHRRRDRSCRRHTTCTSRSARTLSCTLGQISDKVPGNWGAQRASATTPQGKAAVAAEAPETDAGRSM